MFGRRAKGQSDAEQEVDVDVDAVLEQDISTVVQAVDAYLQSPNDSVRKDLLTALEELDAEIDQGDVYHGRVSYPFMGPTSTIIGATSPGSVAQEVPATEFQAQVALVKAAKNAVTRLTPDALAELRAASDVLAMWRT